MPHLRQYVSFFMLLLVPMMATASDFGAAWLRTRTTAAKLNPNISVIGDFLGTSDPDQTESGFELRETEIALQAEVDPYARADFFIGIHDGESPELEEGYISLLSLPLGFQARGGKFLANFGRLNIVHTHELDQVTRPLALAEFLGEEGLNGSGVEVSRVFAPFELFTEVSYALINDLGDDHHHHDEEVVTTEITDNNGNPVNVVVATEEEPAMERKLKNFAHVGRLRIFKDLTDSASVDLGFSGALHTPSGHDQSKLGGADLTVRWKPLQEGLYRSLIWRSEGLYLQKKLEEETDPIDGTLVEEAAKIRRWGGYSYLQFQPARRWFIGVRGDYMESPDNRLETEITRAFSPYITFALSEFNRLRTQYENKRLPSGQTEHRGFLQWTVVIGPHGAHAF